MRNIFFTIFLYAISLTVSMYSFSDQLDVFGYKFGEAVSLPKCPNESPVSNYIKSDCEFKSEYTDRHNVVVIYLPKADIPLYMKGQIDLFTMNGVVEGAKYLTWGESVQHMVLGELIKKYGLPTRKSVDIMQNAYGAKFERINAIWEHKSITVRLRGFLASNREAGAVWVYTKKGKSHAEIIQEFSPKIKSGGGRPM